MWLVGTPLHCTSLRVQTKFSGQQRSRKIYCELAAPDSTNESTSTCDFRIECTSMWSDLHARRASLPRLSPDSPPTLPRLSPDSPIDREPIALPLLTDEPISESTGSLCSLASASASPLCHCLTCRIAHLYSVEWRRNSHEFFVFHLNCLVRVPRMSRQKSRASTLSYCELSYRRLTRNLTCLAPVAGAVGSHKCCAPVSACVVTSISTLSTAASSRVLSSLLLVV